MRKPLLVVAVVVLTVALLLLTGAALIRRDNAASVARAEALVHDLQTLQIGKSDSRAAAAIAVKFGNAPPPPEFRGTYNKENCAATKPLENCAYILAMNNNPLLAVDRNAIIRLQFNHLCVFFAWAIGGAMQKSASTKTSSSGIRSGCGSGLGTGSCAGLLEGRPWNYQDTSRSKHAFRIPAPFKSLMG